MDDKPWLEYYSGESISELVQMGDQYRIDSLIIALHQALDQKGYRLGNDALSDAETTVLSIEGLETEVNNGGYSQYFINSSNEYVGRIVMDLKRIGRDKIAEITERAIAALGVEDLNSDSVGARAAEDDEALYEALDMRRCLFRAGCGYRRQAVRLRQGEHNGFQNTLIKRTENRRYSKLTMGLKRQKVPKRNIGFRPARCGS